jgi:GT2 family glycosyltransferase
MIPAPLRLENRMTVVIINHNTCEQLRACLETVEGEAPDELIVVDNASRDGSAAMVADEFPHVVLLVNSDNPGYGAASNQAIRAARSPYVLLLNSDTGLQSGALQALARYLDEHPRAAIAGPRLINPDGSLQPSCFAFPTPLHLFLQESTLGRMIGILPLIRERYLRTWSHGQARQVPWVLGAALAIRQEPFLNLGGFDETYFMWLEEVDLCCRLQAAGWQTHFTPDATIMHIGGASTRQQKADMSVQYFLSLVHFYRKHYSWARQVQLVAMMKIIVLARLLRDSIRVRLASGSNQRIRLSEDISGWERILLARSDAQYTNDG